MSHEDKNIKEKFDALFADWGRGKERRFLSEHEKSTIFVLVKMMVHSLKKPEKMNGGGWIGRLYWAHPLRSVGLCGEKGVNHLAH